MPPVLQATLCSARGGEAEDEPSAVREPRGLGDPGRGFVGPSVEVDRHAAAPEDVARGPTDEGPGQAPAPPRLLGGDGHLLTQVVVALDAQAGDVLPLLPHQENL